MAVVTKLQGSVFHSPSYLGKGTQLYPHTRYTLLMNSLEASRQWPNDLILTFKLFLIL